MASFLRSLVLLVVLSASLFSLSSALTDAGFTWSATPYQLPGAITDYGDRVAPGAGMMDWQIYVVYKQSGSTSIQWTAFDWDDTRSWTSPAAIDGAYSNGGASFIEYARMAVAAWSDATTETLTWSVQDPNTLTWGNQITSDYSIFPGPPNLFRPLSLQMFGYGRAAGSTDFGNCSYDYYSTFACYTSDYQAWDNGGSAITNVDYRNYFFYGGVNSDGTPDGYLHYTSQYTQDGSWALDQNTGYLVDTDSTVFAVPFQNSTLTYIFVFYKYQGNLFYVTFNFNAGGYFRPATTDGSGFPIGLSSDSGPSAVVYYDPYYDTQVITVFFTKYRAASNDYRVYSALGTPLNWP